MDTEVYNAIGLILIILGALLLFITLLMLTYHKRNDAIMVTILLVGLTSILLGSIIVLMFY